jgi:hypothetical protein
MAARYGQLENLTNSGESMVKQGHFAPPKINDRLDMLKLKWDNLIQIASNRAENLNQTHDFITNSFLMRMMLIHGCLIC